MPSALDLARQIKAQIVLYHNGECSAEDTLIKVNRTVDHVIPAPVAPPDEIGKTYGHLTILADIPRKSDYAPKYYLCRCDCGEAVEVQIKKLKDGVATECKKCERTRRGR